MLGPAKPVLPKATLSKPKETSSGVAPADSSSALAARAYQTEMYEKCVKANTIVVMDTGSGKTLVATLRIKHELAVTSPEKRVWFLTPTVALCKQQCETLQRQIRSVEIRSFSSHDRVECWRTKELWDAALRSVRVAVATYAVLQNALSDGFVKMNSIALIVFDEAHNCVGKSPGSKIMHDFYWPDKDAGREVPHIMGMTASPTNKAGGMKLKKLEETLDAICKSPKVHRESLQSYVNRPTVSAEYYPPAIQGTCRSIDSMRAILNMLDMHKDPEVIRHRTENTEQSRAQLTKVFKTGQGTFVLDQLRTFCTRSEAMCKNLGTLAADFYIAKVVAQFIGPEKGLRSAADEVDQTIFHTWEFSSRAYLAGLLKGVQVNQDALAMAPTTGSVSPKVDCLVRILLDSRQDAMDDSNRGIVFVTERATAVVLHHLLSRHPTVSQLFRVGCVHGSSKHDRGRRDLGDVHNPTDQSDTIAKFRSGEVNLMIATSVAEEGLDVSACNLVVCFDPPKSAKSFIQRRGRARRAGSKYLILVDQTAQEEEKDWEDIEAQLRAEYEREDRESAHQDALAMREKTSYRRFVHPVTGAVLDMENAKGRLQQFCAVARGGARRYVGKQQPFYIFEEIAEQPPALVGPDDAPLVKAKVVLPPACVSYRMRTTWSKKAWRSQRNASKDAAFEAYMRLYRAELVNEYLLPPMHGISGGPDEDMSSLIEIREQFNPWLRIGKALREMPDAPQSYTIVVENTNGSKSSFEAVAPCRNLDTVLPFRALLKDTEWVVRIESQASSGTGYDASSAPRYQLSIKDKKPQLTATETAISVVPQSLAPCILYKMEAHLVAQELQSQFLSDVPVSSAAVRLIRSAITVPARREGEYQSLEFIGEACLKLLATVFLTAKHPLWPEGYLTTNRAKLISNTSLCRAALERKVDRFLLTKPFDAEASRRSTRTDKNTRGREVARRTLAHTVKAIVGAGRQAGGYGAALTWTKALLAGSIDLPSLEVGRMQLYDLVPGSQVPISADLTMVETLAGYSFRKRALLVEALTHGSDISALDHGCYNRLAFLGNAVIESLVSDVIYRELSADKSSGCVALGMMSVYRAAMVNRHYLGYLAMARHVSQQRTAVKSSGAGSPLVQEQYSVEFPLWRFLRYYSGEMADEMSAAEARFATLRGHLTQAVESGDTYPWLLLAQLRANDFFADVVESLVGAVFVDSGAMETCERLLDTMGLLPYLRRMIREKIDVMHPKERLQALTGGKALRYEVGREGGLVCSVFVDDRLVARVEDGVTEDEAHIKAAVEAVTKLSS
ncbi:Dicer-like protein 2 [Madurella mycetomatis]|uniref:Dicer-like protein 2 n=1 Tax=Madurella mycetomatis TaxID=100816 RepID=A0A175VW57_9PEZI|nr:Dicer-like protein 2 [Madurella mycetomatis]